METPDMSIKRGGRKKRWRICVTEHHSAMRKVELMPFAATRMDPEISTLSNKSEGERQTPSDMWNLNYGPVNIAMKQMHTYSQNRSVVAKEEGKWGREGLKVWG